MEYLRTVSGTVYADQLKRYASGMVEAYGGERTIPDNVHIVDYLNSFSGNNKTEFIKTHPLTEEIYTVPYMRRILDFVIYDNNPEYVFNKYLYTDSLSSEKDVSNHLIVDILDDLFLEQVILIDKEEYIINFDFSRYQCSLPLCVSNFSLEGIYRHVKEKYDLPDGYNIGYLKATNVVFFWNLPNRLLG